MEREVIESPDRVETMSPAPQMCRSLSLVAEARRAYRKTAAYRAYLEKRKSSLDYAWSQFRSHARRRGKEFAISKDDYCTVVKMPCKGR